MKGQAVELCHVLQTLHATLRDKGTPLHTELLQICKGGQLFGALASNFEAVSEYQLFQACHLRNVTQALQEGSDHVLDCGWGTATIQ